MEATSLFIAVAMLILLAVTSMRYGVDSRDAFASKERELAARGLVWGGSRQARDRSGQPLAVDSRRTQKGDDCPVIPCGA
ncbi:MAG: hypothetical protein M3Q50_11195 [Chloroflexota bacterium]|nr:hypothetical protein [Chloroflexia bacterium]MDQ3227181.1 hypothetical protein [Chloroflexota bacterium]